MATQTAIRESEHLSLDELTIPKLKSSGRGIVTLRDDPEYEGARKVYNGMLDFCPPHPLATMQAMFDPFYPKVMAMVLES